MEETKVETDTGGVQLAIGVSLLTAGEIAAMRAHLEATIQVSEHEWRVLATLEAFEFLKGVASKRLDDLIVAEAERDAMGAERDELVAEIQHQHRWAQERLCEMEEMHQRQTAGLRERLNQLSQAIAETEVLTARPVVIKVPEGWAPPWETIDGGGP